MTPWLAFLITLSFIILVHEMGHFLMARAVGVKVERFSLGFGPCLARFTRKGTEYAISLFPFGGYVKMAGESAEESPKQPWEYRARSVGERMAIVFAGPFINYAVGFLLFFLIFLWGAPILSATVGEVLKGYPAEAAGLRKGDRILKVNGKSMEDWEEVTQAIRRETASVTLLVERQGEVFDLTLTPKVSEAKNLFGVQSRVGMVGITPSGQTLTRRYPVGQALAKAGERIWGLTLLTLEALFKLASGGISFKESITGPIGIFYITSAVAEQGLLSLLQLIGILSTSLGLFNLLPIPVLDGGHLAFLALERIKGKPVSSRTQEMMTRVGMGFLLVLLVVVTYNDLIKFKIADRFLPFLGRD